ncbi:MAG TPA: PhoH family protein [Thermoanaerobaculaceae bacterium]|nr:PhoH family protein [Thermoanaerobaculaceae bacterium]HRS15085.1 PhoH family protein [Thermoanaerobaculaceae bacterium]
MTSLTLPAGSLEALSGTLEENLRYVAERLRVKLSARGDVVVLDGDDGAVALAGTLLEQLGRLVASGYKVGKEELRTAFRVLEEDPAADLVAFFRDASLPDSLKRLLVPRNLRQRLFIQAVLKEDIVFAIGPAGTGKTYLAVALAAAALAEHRVKRIVLTRPAVEAGERLGFLPGDLVEKVNPYLRPVYDALYDILGYDKVARHLERGVIEIAPLAFMRGRTLNDAFILLDEAQNTTPEQMKMFLTRLGFHSKAVITGDVTQIDLPQERVSGLVQSREILEGMPGIVFFDFFKEDVVRHRLVQRVVDAYEQFEARRNRSER